MKKYTILFGAICAVILAFSLNAKADIMSILNVANSDLAAFGSGPYGTVTVSLSGDTATITFKAASGFEFVDGSSGAVEVNSTDFTPVDGSINPNTAANPASFGFDQHADGFGEFNLTVDYKDASIGVNMFSFMVTDNTNSWVTAADVLTFNAGQGGVLYDAAAHMRATVNNPNGLTGFAGETGSFTNVPDGGATATLLGLGMAGLAGIRARFGRK
jgi:hypothetical protein